MLLTGLTSDLRSYCDYDDNLWTYLCATYCTVLYKWHIVNIMLV